MNDAIEYAEEYSASEQRRFLVTGIIAGALLVAIGKMWFFPWLQEFSGTAACRTVFGLSGSKVLFYGLFVGFPLALAILIGLALGRRGYRILREGRVPPAGEKVFRKTRIVRGTRAKLVGAVLLLAVAFPLALAGWGFGQAQHLTENLAANPQRCAILPMNHH